MFSDKIESHSDKIESHSDKIETGKKRRNLVKKCLFLAEITRKTYFSADYRIVFVIFAAEFKLRPL
jgi:hypothetical protein